MATHHVAVIYLPGILTASRPVPTTGFTRFFPACVTATLLAEPPDVSQLKGLHFQAHITQPAGNAPNVKVVLQQGHRRASRWNAL